MSRKQGLWLITFLLMCPFHAWAVGSSGFENASFSAIALSQGNAVTAQGEEPAAISYNPAAIADLRGIQIQTNTTFTSVLTYHKNRIDDDYLRSGGTIVPVPTGYVTIHPPALLNDRLTIGIGSDSPFGLINKYDSRHNATRYTGYVNYLKMYTIKPTLAVRLTDWLSVGAGPVYYRVYDYGGIQAYPNVLLGGAFPDGQVRLNMAGHSWGWQFGALLKPHEKHHFGFYFRSPTNMMVSGLGKVENATVGGNFETGAWARLNLPWNMTWAYAFRPTKRLTLETDFGFTRWATFRRLYIYSDPVNASDDAIMAAIGHGSGNDRDYRDTFSIHWGGNYDMTDKLTVRGGGHFYTAAVPKTHLRPSVADSNRLSFSGGLSYALMKNMYLDLSYYLALGLRRHVDNEISESLGATVDGRYMSVFQLLTVSVRFAWENIFEVGKQRNKTGSNIQTPVFPRVETPQEEVNTATGYAATASGQEAAPAQPVEEDVNRVLQDEVQKRYTRSYRPTSGTRNIRDQSPVIK